MGIAPLDPEDEHLEELPAPRAGAGAIPLSLRVCWWGLLGCDAVMVAAVIGLGEEFGARLVLAGLPGPLFNAAMMLFVGWWHTRGPGRRHWRRPERGDWAHGAQGSPRRRDDAAK